MKAFENKVTKPRGFSDEWKFPRAIERLFLDAVPTFSFATKAASRYNSAKELAKKIRTCIASATDADVCDQFRKSYPELEPLVDVLRRTSMPLDVDRRTHALIWLRVAVLSGVRLSSTVLSEYSSWRTQVDGAHLQDKIPPKLTLTKRSATSPRDLAPQILRTTFSIEEVVLGGALVNDTLNLQRKWTLVSTASIGAQSPVATQHKPGERNQTSPRKKIARSEKRSVAQVCGTALLELLGVNLSAIASGPKAGIVRKQKGDVKFVSTLGRNDLARRLQDMDVDLRGYSESTIVRALPTLVQCPRGRRGGRAV